MASPGFEITPLDWGTLRSRRGTFALWKRNPLFCAVSASVMDGNAIQIWVVLFSILLLGCQTMKPGEEVCVEGGRVGRSLTHRFVVVQKFCVLPPPAGSCQGDQCWWG